MLHDTEASVVGGSAVSPSEQPSTPAQVFSSVLAPQLKVGRSNSVNLAPLPKNEGGHSPLTVLSASRQLFCE